MYVTAMCGLCVDTASNVIRHVPVVPCEGRTLRLTTAKCLQQINKTDLNPHCTNKFVYNSKKICSSCPYTPTPSPLKSQKRKSTPTGTHEWKVWWFGWGGAGARWWRHRSRCRAWRTARCRRSSRWRAPTRTSTACAPSWARAACSRASSLWRHTTMQKVTVQLTTGR